MELFSQYLNELISALIGGIIGAGVSIPLTVRMMNRRASDEGTVSDQRGASAGGDIAGRDHNSNS